MSYALPESPFASIRCLLRLFCNTTNSYKYLFFLSLLDHVVNRSDENAPRIKTHQVIESSLALSWYPHSYFRLSFGKRDQIGLILDQAVGEVQIGDSCR